MTKSSESIIAEDKHRKLICVNNYFEILPLDSKVKSKYVNKKKDLSDFESNNFNIVLELTRSCPMTCRYCFISEINDKEKLELKSNSKQNIDLLIDQIENTKYKFKICFHGGEPLLEKELIKYTIDEIKKRNLNKRISYSIQTSGYNLDEDFIQFIKVNKIGVGLSIDSINNGLRNSDVGLNASILLHKHNVSHGIIVVVNKTNQDTLFEDFKQFVEKYRVNGILYNLIDHKNIDYFPDLDVVKTQVENIIRYSTKNQLDVVINPLKLFADRIIGKFSSLCYDSGCGCFKRILAYSVDGKFYPCDTFVDNNEFSVFTLDSIKFSEKRVHILKLVEQIKTELGCNDCKYNFICRIPCIGKHKLFNNKQSLKLSCDYNKMWLDLFSKSILKNPLNIKYFARILNSKLNIKEMELFYILPDKDFVVEDYLLKD